MTQPNISFELRHLRYFISAATSGSFRKAAKALEVRESAISRGVRDLEDQIGASLFLRHSGGVNLTLAGQRFLQRARHAIDQLNEGAKEVGYIGSTQAGHLNIGLLSSLASGFLSALFYEFDEQYPGIIIDFQQGSSREHLDSVGNFMLDIAFVIGNIYDHKNDVIELWRENLFFALWESHPLCAKSELHWKDLVRENFLIRPGGPGEEVSTYLTWRLGQFGRKPSISIQNVGRYQLLSLVASRRGVVPVLQSETAISIPRVAYRPLAGEVLPFYAISSPKNDNPAARALLSLARTMSRSAGSHS